MGAPEATPTTPQPVVAPTPVIPDAPTEQPKAIAVPMMQKAEDVKAAPVTQEVAKPMAPAEKMATPIMQQQEEPLAPAAQPEQPQSVLDLPTTIVEPIIAELPKADTAFAAKIVDNFNNNHFDQLAAMFSGDGMLVTLNDEMADAAASKAKLEAMKNMLSASKMSIAIDNVNNTVPGSATFNGKLTTTSVDGKVMSGTVTGALKYDSHEWKIASMHFSSKALSGMLAEQKLMEESNPMTQNSIFAFAGLVIGLIVSKLFKRKGNAPQAMMNNTPPTQG